MLDMTKSKPEHTETKNLGMQGRDKTKAQMEWKYVHTKIKTV